VVIESLSDEYDLMEIAMGAVKLLHLASGSESHDDEEIPDVEPYAERPARGKTRGKEGDGRPPSKRIPREGGRPEENRGGQMTRLFVGAGRAAGVRPKDLVGAITGEAGLTGRQVGDIDISDRFSLVEVPSDMADAVITSLRRSKIKGKKVTVRRERDKD
jgi:ATP-dependent RNA helicase DeaD